MRTEEEIRKRLKEREKQIKETWIFGPLSAMINELRWVLEEDNTTRENH
jgi:hypothetical protein